MLSEITWCSRATDKQAVGPTGLQGRFANVEQNDLRVPHARLGSQRHAVQFRGARLDDVPGVGPARKKALLRKFGSVKAIREASVEELAATVGMTRSAAEAIKRAL